MYRMVSQCTFLVHQTLYKSLTFGCISATKADSFSNSEVTVFVKVLEKHQALARERQCYSHVRKAGSSLKSVLFSHPPLLFSAVVMNFIERLDPMSQCYPSNFSYGFHQRVFGKIIKRANVFCDKPSYFTLYHVEYFHSFEKRSVLQKNGYLGLSLFHFVSKTRFYLTVPLFLHLQVVSSFSLTYCAAVEILFQRTLIFLQGYFLWGFVFESKITRSKGMESVYTFLVHFCRTLLFRAEGMLVLFSILITIEFYNVFYFPTSPQVKNIPFLSCGILCLPFVNQDQF